MSATGFEALELREAGTAPALQAVDGAPPLDLFEVHKTWRKTGHSVLRGVDLTLDPGACAWVGGRNGVGKTTLLRVAAGLIGAERGHVLAFGLNPRRDRREFQRRVAFLSAGNTGLYARLSVRLQIDTWARIQFVPRARRPLEVQRALGRFELLDLAEARCDRISMGQRQRVRLAMTFVGAPDLVLLDEPETSLDDTGHELLRKAIGETRARGGAVLWVSPSSDRSAGDFTERYALEQGRLRAL